MRVALCTERERGTTETDTETERPPIFREAAMSMAICIVPHLLHTSFQHMRVELCRERDRGGGEKGGTETERETDNRQTGR